MAEETRDKIAIVGIACKFPGAENLEEFWNILERGENFVRGIPRERWNHDAYYDPDPQAIGKSYPRTAGLLSDPLAFDNKLFNINDFEADEMDPQQRHVLECSYRALEDAGITLDQLRGSNTGVFVGAMNDDYRSTRFPKLSTFSHTTGTGVANSLIAARVSFVFDLRGPAATVDTACSSSLAAMHIGIQNLMTGECDMVLCGGTNFIMTPDVFIHLGKANMASREGQCFAFSDKADGYARGEGCGMVILKRLSDAEKCENKIWATIHTGWNQDGRSVTPISAPSEEQQFRLLEHVFKKANVNPNEITYIEAHGTGTPVGDIVELSALGRFFENTDHSIYIGSVKTNIGHLEPAAAVPSLIKILLMMKHSKIVPSLHFHTPNPKINFKNFIVPVEVTNWLDKEKTACLNSFGFGGTNSHVIVHSATHTQPTQNGEIVDREKSYIVCFSGKTTSSLKDSVVDFRNYNDINSLNLCDISYTSTVRRNHYPLRYATVATSLDNLLQHVKDDIPNIYVDSDSIKQQNIVFVFSGMGSAWVGMGREMMKASSEFKKAIQEVDSYLCKLVKWSLEQRMIQEDNLRDKEYWPVAIFACQVALARIWMSLGVTPAFIVGYSVGEVAAAYIAGILSLSDAVTIIYYRTMVLAEVDVPGQMFMVTNMPIHEVKEIVSKYHGNASVSIEMSPVCCVVSGYSETVELIWKELELCSDIVLTDLKLPMAYHSCCVDGCKEKLIQALTGISPRTNVRTNMISTVTGEKVASNLGKDYWVDNMRQPVKFFEAITKTVKPGMNNIYIEVGPKPFMTSHVNTIFPDHKNVHMIKSMHEKLPEWSTLLQGITSLYRLGCSLRWEKLPHDSQVITPIPRYHFDVRRSLQLSAAACFVQAGVRFSCMTHPFVYAVDATSTDIVPQSNVQGSITRSYKVILTVHTFPSIIDHSVSNTLIVPGALYTEIAFAVQKQTHEMNAPQYSVSVTFVEPCPFTKRDPVLLDVDVRQISTLATRESFASFNISVKKGSKILASIQLNAHCVKSPRSAINITQIKSHCSQIVTRETVYDNLKKLGFFYGPNYTLIQSCQKSDDSCLAVICVPSALLSEIAGTTIHPSVLDSMIQTFVVLRGTSEETNIFPSSIGKLTIFGTIQEKMYIYTQLKRTAGNTTYFDIKLTTLCGEVIGDLEDLAFKFLSGRSAGVERGLEYLCDFTWVPKVTNYTQRQTSEPYALFVTDHFPETTEQFPQENYIKYNVNDSSDDVIDQLKRKVEDADHRYKCIVIDCNVGIEDSEDGYSIQHKATKLFMMLRTIFIHPFTLPIYMFTRWAVHVENTSSDKECINPIMTTLWGMFRCVLLEDSTRNVTAIDIHMPKQKCSLHFMASVAETVQTDCSLHNIREWVATEESLFVRQYLQIGQRIPVPTYREVFSDHAGNVVSVSSNPLCVADTFNVYYDNPTTGKNKTNFVICITHTALHHPKLFTMSIQHSEIRKGDSYLGNGFIVFALEMCGTVVMSETHEKLQSEVVTCYPSPIGSKINVPANATISKTVFKQYRPGDLTRIVVLWYLSQKIVTNSVTILMSSNTEKLGEILREMIISQRETEGITVEMVSVEEVKETSNFYKTVVSLVRMDTNLASIIAKHWADSECFVTLKNLMNSQVRSLIGFLRPNVELIALDITAIFHPSTIETVVCDVKRWIDENALIMERVSECLSSVQALSVDTNNAVEDITDLLKVQPVTIDRALVRVDKTKLFMKNGLYIVVGGLTGLGWSLVKFLAHNGAGYIAIMNRRHATKENNSQIAQLCSENRCYIRACQADVTKHDAVKNVIDLLEKKFPEVSFRGVFFGAAVLQDKQLSEMTQDDLQEVMLPKIVGAWNLHQLTKHKSLDFFVLHSSVVSVTGNLGQTNYAAANAFMDGLAHYRRNMGLPGQSINWGPLKLGMLENKEHLVKLLESHGLISLDEEEINAAIIPILMYNWAQIVACNFNWQRWKNPNLSALQDAEQTMENVKEDIRRQLEEAMQSHPECRLEIIEKYLVNLITRVLGVDLGIVQYDSDLRTLGMDSIIALTVIAEIYSSLQCRIPPIALLSGDPTPKSIAQNIEEELRKNNN